MLVTTKCHIHVSLTSLSPTPSPLLSVTHIHVLTHKHTHTLSHCHSSFPSTLLSSLLFLSPSLLIQTYIMSRENDLHLLPGGVRGQLLVDKVLEVFMQSGHEVSTRSDAVGIKPRLSR